MSDGSAPDVVAPELIKLLDIKEKLFPVPQPADAGLSLPKTLMMEPTDSLPHGTHPSTVRIIEYRESMFGPGAMEGQRQQLPHADFSSHLKWGAWAPLKVCKCI